MSQRHKIVAWLTPSTDGTDMFYSVLNSHVSRQFEAQSRLRLAAWSLFADYFKGINTNAMNLSNYAKR